MSSTHIYYFSRDLHILIDVCGVRHEGFVITCVGFEKHPEFLKELEYELEEKQANYEKVSFPLLRYLVGWGEHTRNVIGTFMSFARDYDLVKIAPGNQ